MQNPSKLRPFFENIEYEREGTNMILNFGPQHPSAHGQLKLVLELDGERIVRARAWAICIEASKRWPKI